MLCPVYGHELTPLSCPPHQGVSFRSFKGLIILSPYKGRNEHKISLLRFRLQPNRSLMRQPCTGRHCVFLLHAHLVLVKSGLVCKIAFRGQRVMAA